MLKRVSTIGLSAVAVVAVLSLISLALRWHAPSLYIGHNGPTVSINVSTLGEYPTTITRLRLSDFNSKRVLWEVEAKDGEAQSHGFTLHKGENATEPATDFGGYQVVTPSRSATFTLSSGREYKIEAWGGRSNLTRSSAVFRLDGGQ